MQNRRWLIARIPLIVFLVDLPFAILVYFAYLHILDPSLQAISPGLAAVLGGTYVLKTAFWVSVLWSLLGPLRRWSPMAGGQTDGDTLISGAASAAYDLPRNAAIPYALSWALPFLLMGVWLAISGSADIPTRPGHMIVTVLFSLAVFGGSFLAQYFFLTWMLSPFTEALSLEVRRRNLSIPWRGSSLRARLISLALLLSLPPVLWVTAVAYVSEVEQNTQRVELRAQVITGLLASSLESNFEAPPQPIQVRRVVNLHQTDRSRSFVLYLDTGVIEGRAAREYFADTPGVERWVREVVMERDAGLSRLDDGGTSFAFQRITQGESRLVVGTIAWFPAAVSNAFLLSMSLFGVVAMAWILLSAFFLSKSAGGSIDRISTVVRRIARQDDARDTARVPILQQDELGALAESINVMTDRLAASAVDQVRAQQRIAFLAEASVRRAAELRGVLDNMVEAVMVCNPEGKVTIVNRAARRLFGSGAKEGKLASDMIESFQCRDLEGNSCAPVGHPLLRALRGETVVQEMLMLPGEGEQRLLSVTAAPILEDQGVTVGALSVAADVTELRELDRLKDQFIKVAAHELKTPVAIVKGYAQLLNRRMPDVSEANQRLLDAIDSGADRIDRIVTDLLDISQLYGDRLHFRFEPTDWSAIMEQLVADTQGHEPARGFHWTAPGPIAVEADPKRLRQVGQHLLSNAVKYSPQGGDIYVSLSIENGSARLDVRDWGIGIPEAKQARIFETFYRAHTDTPYDYGGMGVGLYISREIVRRHGGEIWFDSREGEGSTFHVRLPLSPHNRAATE